VSGRSPNARYRLVRSMCTGLWFLPVIFTLTGASGAAEVEARCPDGPADDVLEGCWQHPEAGLMCPSCAVQHRSTPILHPWPDEHLDVCDVCATGPTLRRTLVDPHVWRPYTRTLPVAFPALGQAAVWPVTVCDHCADSLTRRDTRASSA
jgi:hypothetical protein